MRHYLKFSIILFLFNFVSPAIAQGVSMSPTRLFFTGKPGEVVSQNVIMYNSSNTDYVFNINFKDWNRLEDGTKVYFESGELNHSNSNWISTVETNLKLSAKSSQEVLITMRIPSDASSVDLTNSMLFFTQIGKQKDEVKLDKGIGIIALFEFGLHIYYTPPNNTTNSLDILSIDTVKIKETDSEHVQVRVFNDGNIVNDATVELELTHTDSGKETKLDPINISMMPSTYQTVNLKLPKHLKGEYLGVVIIKMAGTNDLRVGEKSFTF